ncbi:MAG: cupin domain-containing protein [Polyangiales bacterium]
MTTVQSTADGSVIVRGADAEVVGREPTRVQLLVDSSATRGALSGIKVTLGKDADGARPHTHRGSSELFYVLDGGVQVLSGTDIVTAERGDLIVVPPNLPHAFGAAHGKGAELLIVVTPGIDRFDYFRKLERIAFGKDPPESLLAVQDLFDTYFLQSAAWEAARAEIQRGG